MVDNMQVERESLWTTLLRNLIQHYVYCFHLKHIKHGKQRRQYARVAFELTLRNLGLVTSYL